MAKAKDKKGSGKSKKDADKGSKGSGSKIAKSVKKSGIMDLIEGAKAAGAIASNEEWKAARPAQFSVPEAGLVEAVREVLGRHFG